jgi:hypothetical protein
VFSLSRDKENERSEQGRNAMRGARCPDRPPAFSLFLGRGRVHGYAEDDQTSLILDDDDPVDHLVHRRPPTAWQLTACTWYNSGMGSTN